MKFDFDDIIIKPSIISGIESRKEINPYINKSRLPLIGAPMDTVFSTDSVYYGNRPFINRMPICIPRVDDSTLFKWIYDFNSLLEKNNNTENMIQVDFNDKIAEIVLLLKSESFISVSLRQFDLLINQIKPFYNILDDGRFPLRILIDIANGHMQSLHDSIRDAKKKFDNLTIMAGNIANPKTYVTLSEAGADYIRCSIGSGSACTTSANVAVGYPMASLIEECYKESMVLNNPAKIVADGGFKNFSDIIKALTLGADYVMIGSILNKSIEANSTAYWKSIKVPETWKSVLFRMGLSMQHEYRGMSTKKVQKTWGKKQLTTSEGIVKRNDIEYEIGGWINNFEDYLRSAMSYCNSKTLEEFKNNAEYELISMNSHKRFDK